MSMENDIKTKLSPFLSFENILRTIGFVADMTAIVSVILALRLPNVGGVLSIIISPITAFIIWIMAFYTYFCLLHDYWIKTKDENDWSSKFSGFVAYNLFACFNKPWLLFPLLLLMNVLYAIAYLAPNDRSVSLLAIVILTFAIIIFSLVVYGVSFENAILDAQMEKSNKLALEDRIIVDKKWKLIKSAIDKKSANAQWLNEETIKDLLVLYKLDSEIVEYIFSRYAAENPEHMIYCSVLYKKNIKGNYSTKFDSCVLVNLAIIDREKYTI